MPGVMRHTCNLSTEEAETREWREFKTSLSYIVKPCLREREREYNARL
jgi:hypothetical protein